MGCGIILWWQWQWKQYTHMQFFCFHCHCPSTLYEQISNEIWLQLHVAVWTSLKVCSSQFHEGIWRKLWQNYSKFMVDSTYRNPLLLFPLFTRVSLSVFSWLPPSRSPSRSRIWPSWSRVCSAGRRSRRPSCAVCSRDGTPARNNCNETRYTIYSGADPTFQGRDTNV